MADTDIHPAIESDRTVCKVHHTMLPKGEFRWVLGVLIGLMTAIGGGSLIIFASADAVEANRATITETRRQILEEKAERKELARVTNAGMIRLTAETRDEIKGLRREIKDAIRNKP